MLLAQSEANPASISKLLSRFVSESLSQTIKILAPSGKFNCKLERISSWVCIVRLIARLLISGSTSQIAVEKRKTPSGNSCTGATNVTNRVTPEAILATRGSGKVTQQLNTGSDWRVSSLFNGFLCLRASYTFL